ncbi:MAG: flagellar hook-associated protein 2 [Peptococcaceae bacterium]|nr:flagellar hook-associated protein 2 [Peptococcaceae bacterium]
MYYGSINRITGLASGLDIEQIVEDLMRVERKPLDKLLQDKQLLEWKQEDYRSINTALRAFRDGIASAARLQSSYLARKATSSDETVVTAAVGANAQPGTYTVTVHQLAEVASDISTVVLSADPADKIDPDVTIDSQAAKFATSPSATVLEFSISTYDEEGNVITENFTVDTTVDSLNDVIARINAKSATLGVTAFYEESTDKVVISTTRTGDYATPEIKIEDITGNFALGTLQLEATADGKNAIVDINGLTGITKYENTFTLNNVTFNLKNTGTATVMVERDTDAVVEFIKSFVEEYNNILETINAKLNEPRYRDYPPLTEEQKKEMSDREIELWEEKARSGMLRSDPLLTRAIYALRNAFASRVEGVDTAYDTIYEIGITPGSYQEGGKLYIDEEKLREAVEANPEAVMDLFTASGETTETTGLAKRVYDELKDVIELLTDKAGYPSSFSLYDNSFMGKSLREIEERIDQMEERLQEVEERYWREFTALEQYIAQMNAQSMWLMQQMQ